MKEQHRSRPLRINSYEWIEITSNYIAIRPVDGAHGL
jgi:hypothetical protein